MTIEAILKNKGQEVFTLRPESSTGDATALLANKRIGAVVVCDSKGRILGVLSERDIVRGMSQYGKGVYDMPVRNLMSSPVTTCTLKDSVKKMMGVMNSKRFRHLPVVDGEELVGIISIGDLVSARINAAEMEMGVLKDIAFARR
ncbi:MAG: CBS domain-containing protein [Alphaproteobacteria bacterium]|nr:CBS domain-containing protein [Alphaproteobacteria bacterium]